MNLRERVILPRIRQHHFQGPGACASEQKLYLIETPLALLQESDPREKDGQEEVRGAQGGRRPSCA